MKILTANRKKGSNVSHTGGKGFKFRYVLVPLLFLAGCASNPVVKGEWIDPCAKVQERLEESDLRAYLASGERDDLTLRLRALAEGVCGFVKHPHTCAHKRILVNLLEKAGYRCEQP